jgi:uncharacterized protein YggE
MSDDKRHIIDVYGEHEEELDARAVDVLVTVQGSSFFTGRTALKKAKEIAEIVERLAADAGIEEASIELVSVRAEVRSGLLGKTSSAVYELQIRCEDLERLPGVLGVVTSAKQATIDQLTWRYPDDAATEGRLLEAAATRAAVKAQAIARALDARIVAPAEVREVKHHAGRDDVQLMARDAATAGAARLRVAAEPVDLGVQIRHRKLVKREVRVTYLIDRA